MPDGFEVEFADGVGPTRRCAQGTSELEAAETALRVLGAAVDADTPMDINTLRSQVRALLQMTCFAAAQESALPSVASVRGFRRWWRDGGRAWFRSYLAPLTPDSRSIVFPPQERRTLTAESAGADHPLAPLLCSATDESCGRETAPFEIRAEQSFRAHHIAYNADEFNRPNPPEPPRAQHCAAEAREAPRGEAYDAWYACVDGRHAMGTLLPAELVRMPDRGYLVIRGRRGHYDFCDELRVYDLANGDAFIAKSCSGLALMQNGGVHGPATDAARRDTTQVGQLSVLMLRELAWMILLAPESDDRAPIWDSEELPASIEPIPSPGLASTFDFESRMSSSAHTTLDWAWVVDGCSRYRGSFTYPESDSALETHINELLEVAEASLNGECVMAGIPADLPLDVNAHEYPAQIELEQTLRAMNARICP